MTVVPHAPDGSTINRAGADAAADAFESLPIIGIDHVRLHVGSARQCAWAYERLGFRIRAHAGLETGVRDRASWCLQQGDIRLVVTAAIAADSPIAADVRAHGDSVRDVAFTVADTEAAFEYAVRRGAKPVTDPHRITDGTGEVMLGSIRAPSGLTHTFVQRDGYDGAFLPGYEPWPGNAAVPVGVRTIDHVVTAVATGDSEEIVDFYARALGFRKIRQFDDSQIATDYSALMNKIMADGSGRIKFPIVEPANGSGRSQVQEFLDYHGGPGVQHIALDTPDIVHTVEELRGRGLRFAHTPNEYYAGLPDRVVEVIDRLPALRRNGILADRDDEGYLLQVFAAHFHDRPTFFFELIERHGAIGFGEGNIRALYEALEREQGRRGNL